MKMNRREFLKLLGITAAAVTTPLLLTKANTDDEQEWKHVVISWNDGKTEFLMDKIPVKSIPLNVSINRNDIGDVDINFNKNKSLNHISDISIVDELNGEIDKQKKGIVSFWIKQS